MRCPGSLCFPKEHVFDLVCLHAHDHQCGSMAPDLDRLLASYVKGFAPYGFRIRAFRATAIRSPFYQPAAVDMEARPKTWKFWLVVLALIVSVFVAILESVSYRPVL